jgi:hypothetical protein
LAQFQVGEQIQHLVAQDHREHGLVQPAQIEADVATLMAVVTVST